MGSFRNYLFENEDVKQQITDIINTLSEDELDEFGYVLFYEFFDNEETDEDNYESFDLDDVVEMLDALDNNVLDDVLDLLSDDFEMDESVTVRMKTKSFNKKKKKYMATSKAQLRRTKAARKKKARLTKGKKKRYYKANKAKISKYQKSRSKAIKSGKHVAKVRRNA